jgi:hypothetical protein
MPKNIRYWTDEDKTIFNNLKDHLNDKELGKVLGRTPDAIAYRRMAFSSGKNPLKGSRLNLYLKRNKIDTWNLWPVTWAGSTLRV